jgi:transposase-like protein
VSAEAKADKPAQRVVRRKFSVAFKRKAVDEAERTSMAAVINKYKLPSNSYKWRLGFKKPQTKPQRKPQVIGPQREAIIYLKHAEKAFAAGKAKRGQLLARLALSTLTGD